MASRYQRAKRYAYWRGFFLTLTAISGWFCLSGIAGGITG